MANSSTVNGSDVSIENHDPFCNHFKTLLTQKTLVCQEYLMVISRLFVMSIDTNNKSIKSAIQHFFALKNLRIILTYRFWHVYCLIHYSTLYRPILVSALCMNDKF